MIPDLQFAFEDVCTSNGKKVEELSRLWPFNADVQVRVVCIDSWKTEDQGLVYDDLLYIPIRVRMCKHPPESYGRIICRERPSAGWKNLNIAGVLQKNTQEKELGATSQTSNDEYICVKVEINHDEHRRRTFWRRNVVIRLLFVGDSATHLVSSSKMSLLHNELD